MLKLRVLIITFILNYISFELLAQKEEQLSDSTIVFGVITESCFISKTLNQYCMVESEKFIHEQKSVIVKGILACDRSSKSTLVEIILNNESYYIEKDNLTIVSTNFYEQYNGFSDSQKEKFKNKALDASNYIRAELLTNTLNFINKCNSKGLCIINWNLNDESEYTEGTGINVKVLNPTKKTIKYIWFTYVGYNPVNDKVVDRLKGTSAIQVKAVGPIKPEESGTYNFEYVWHTDLVETAKLIQVKIQYLDGTFKLISDSNSIKMTPEMKELFEEQ